MAIQKKLSVQCKYDVCRCHNHACICNWAKQTLCSCRSKGSLNFLMTEREGIVGLSDFMVYHMNFNMLYVDVIIMHAYAIGQNKPCVVADLKVV